MHIFFYFELKVVKINFSLLISPVCGTTGKRKACKDCSCGFAEELANGTKATAPASENAKSSCGSVRFSESSKLSKVFEGFFAHFWFFFSTVVLFGRCIPMCQLPIPWYASIQTWRKGTIGWWLVERWLVSYLRISMGSKQWELIIFIPIWLHYLIRLAPNWIVLKPFCRIKQHIDLFMCSNAKCFIYLHLLYEQ